MWSPSRVAEQRAAKRKCGVFVFINLWPFTAVLIVLLVIFMVHARPTHDYWRGIADLPKGQTSVSQRGAIREDAILILVSRDGATYLNHSEIRLKDLAPAVRAAIRDGAEKKAYVSADARAKNIDVERVVDELACAGITQISFITN
jgi:biopolymer transport protein TolR